MGATGAIRRLRTPEVFNLKKEEREMEATHVADWKATYIYVYVRSLYLYHCRLVSKIFEIYKFGENNSVLIQGGLGCLILQVQNYRKGCSQLLKFSRVIKRVLFQITFEVLRLEGEEGSLCCHLQHNSN
jgi:hypothetical protein